MEGCCSWGNCVASDGIGDRETCSQPPSPNTIYGHTVNPRLLLRLLYYWNNRVGYYSVSVTEFKGSAIMRGYGDSGQFLQIEIDFRILFTMSVDFPFFFQNEVFPKSK